VSRLELQQQTESQHQQQQLVRIEDQLHQQQSRGTTRFASMGGILTAISEVSQMLTSLGEAVASLQILVTNHRFFRGPMEDILVFEDSFGRIDPFPKNWVNSWEVRSRHLPP
jgi:hypothetical protein